MSYPHVTQFETLEMRAALAARRSHPKRVRDRRVARHVLRRRAAEHVARA